MRFIKIICAVALTAGITTGVFSESNADLGNKISRDNDSQPKFQKVKGDVVFQIFGKDGEMKFKKRMVMAQLIENMGKGNEVEKSISTFKEPADDSGNSFMAYNYKNQEDVKYVYLKGIKKAKKVSGATRKGSFFGSDFSNDDMGYPDFNEFNYKFIGKEKVTFKGKSLECSVIELLPKNDSIKNAIGYGRKVGYMYKANDKSYLTLKLEFYDTDMKKFKVQTLTSFVAKKNAKGEMVIYTTGLIMKNLKTGTRTELSLENLKFENDADIKPEIFTEQWLSRKWW